MEIKKPPKVVTISICVPEPINDYLNKAVESHNKSHPDTKISKSYLVSAIIHKSIMDFEELMTEKEKQEKPN